MRLGAKANLPKRATQRGGPARLQGAGASHRGRRLHGPPRSDAGQPGGLRSGSTLPPTHSAVYDEHYFAIDSAIATYNYAHALNHLGRYQEADTELNRAISVLDSHKSEYHLATAELLRASVLASLGRHADALTLVASARQRWRSLNNEGELPECDTIEGEVLRKAGRARDAVPYIEQAIAVSMRSRNAIEHAEAELELALTLRDFGDPNARTHANRAREIFQTLNLPLRAQEVSELHPRRDRDPPDRPWLKRRNDCGNGHKATRMKRHSK